VFHIECFLQENSKEYKFKWKHHDTGVEEEVSVYDYYKRRYNIMLDHYLLPLVKTTKKDVVYPMELVWTMPNQKYPFKLDETQVCSAPL
jgi:eukaryotic translation initiation factor 2C